MAPAAKMDSAKKSEKTKNEKQKPGRNTSEGNAGGKKNTLGGSRGKSSRGSSPVPSSRPASAVLEEERKKPGYKHFFSFSAKFQEYFIRLIALNEINTRYFRETLNRLVFVYPKRVSVLLGDTYHKQSSTLWPGDSGMTETKTYCATI